jgi:polyferredoxin
VKYNITIVRWLFLALFLFLIVSGKVVLWLGLFGASLLVALFFGRVYCGYACPMNTLMIPAEGLSKKLNMKRKKAPQFLQSGKVAWVALAASILAMLIFKKAWQINLPILPLWLVVSLFFTFQYGPATFHNLICPFGVLQRLFGKYARFSHMVNGEDCSGCKRCEKICPTEAIEVNEENKKASIDPALCFQCGSCRQVCREEMISYSRT